MNNRILFLELQINEPHVNSATREYTYPPKCNDIRAIRMGNRWLFQILLQFSKRILISIDILGHKVDLISNRAPSSLSSSVHFIAGREGGIDSDG